MLGGRPRQAEEEENQFDVNMEKIMSRFNTFNSLMSASSSTDDDNEEEEQPEEQPEDETEKTELVEEEKVENVEVVLPDTSLEPEYADNSYWRADGCEDSLDDLLADYE